MNAIELIQHSIPVFAYSAASIPSVGETVKRTDGMIQEWRVTAVCHVIGLDRRVTLTVEEV